MAWIWLMSSGADVPAVAETSAAFVFSVSFIGSANYRIFPVRFKPGDAAANGLSLPGWYGQTDMTSNPQGQSILPLLQFCQEHQAEMLETLKRMVEIESPSDNKAAVDQLGQLLAQEFERIGGKVTVDPQTKYGNHLKAEFSGSSSGKPVMLLGHFDTVWPLGILAGMPFRMDAGRAYGPGVYDMKAGIVMMLFAVRGIQAMAKSCGNDTGQRPVVVLLDTDEEVGSATGRPLVEATARQCDAVLV